MELQPILKTRKLVGQRRQVLEPRWTALDEDVAVKLRLDFQRGIPVIRPLGVPQRTARNRRHAV